MHSGQIMVDYRVRREILKLDEGTKVKPREFSIYSIMGSWHVRDRGEPDERDILVREVIPSTCFKCGGVILADTEEWKSPLCYSCFAEFCPEDAKLGKVDAAAAHETYCHQEDIIRKLRELLREAKKAICGIPIYSEDFESNLLRDTFLTKIKQAGFDE